MNLKPETIEKIEKLLTRYPVRRSATIMILHAIQEDQGYISPEAVEWAAAKLGIEPIAVLEVVTFYPMFRQKPLGRVHVKVCRTLSCALRGAYKVADTLQEELKCGLGATSADGNFTIEFVECLASCGTAPVVQVDAKLHENVTPERARELASRLKAENPSTTTAEALAAGQGSKF